MQGNVRLTIFSLKTWNIATLIELLERERVFKPTKWGPSEPAEFSFNVTDLPAMEYHWQERTGFLLESESPHYTLSLMNSLKVKKPNWLGLNLEASFFVTDESAQIFLRFVESLFVWSDGLYAFSCHRNEFDQQNRLLRPTMIRGKLIATASYPIIGCLPGVYWANIFGTPYINWFGYERIVSAPGYSRKEFDNGAVMI